MPHASSLQRPDLVITLDLSCFHWIQQSAAAASSAIVCTSFVCVLASKVGGNVVPSRSSKLKVADTKTRVECAPAPHCQRHCSINLFIKPATVITEPLSAVKGDRPASSELGRDHIIMGRRADREVFLGWQAGKHRPNARDTSSGAAVMEHEEVVAVTDQHHTEPAMALSESDGGNKCKGLRVEKAAPHMRWRSMLHGVGLHRRSRVSRMGRTSVVMGVGGLRGQRARTPVRPLKMLQEVAGEAKVDEEEVDARS